MKKKILILTMPGDNPFDVKEIIKGIDKKAIQERTTSKKKAKRSAVRGRSMGYMAMGGILEWETIRIALTIAELIKFLFELYIDYRNLSENHSFVFPLLFESGKKKVEINLQKSLSKTDIARIVDLYI